MTLEPGPDDTVVVTDLDSANGTTVDGVALTGSAPAYMGSLVRIGDTRIEIGEVRGPLTDGMYTELVNAADMTHSSIEIVADAAVDDLRANVLGVDDESGTLTVVFSDIESSTELAVSLGDAVWFDVLQRHGRLVEAHVSAHGGRIVKHQGDGYMLVFSKRAAARCAPPSACNGTWPRPRGPRRARSCRFASGCTPERLSSTRTAICSASTWWSRPVSARSPRGRRSSSSSLVRQIAEARGDITFRNPRQVELRGIEGVETVWTVDWRTYEPA